MRSVPAIWTLRMSRKLLQQSTSVLAALLPTHSGGSRSILSFPSAVLFHHVNPPSYIPPPGITIRPLAFSCDVLNELRLYSLILSDPRCLTMLSSANPSGGSSPRRQT